MEASTLQPQSITFNDRSYRCPESPLVVVCIDGGDPEYVAHGLSAGIIPITAGFIKNGFYAVARGSMPSFTCPNNMSIVTATEPETHGISGNFFLNPKTGVPVVMTGPELLRARPILSEFSRHGFCVASITAKDKLRKQLQKDMQLTNGSVSFSAQSADTCTMDENGIENVLAFVGQQKPDMYSADLSLFVLDAGIKLLEERRPKILYLSLTDFIQHAHAPGDPAADTFYIDMEARFARMIELGATVALTADHGMGDKADENGKPNVIWLQDVLDAAVGAGKTRVICPITDAFIGHHGALGGFVRVYTQDGVSKLAIAERIRGIAGVENCWLAEDAARELEQPLDREGDIAIVGDKRTVIGGRCVDHDLSALKGHRLRTHGSLHETAVPFILSKPLNPKYLARAANGLRSHNIFEFALNGTV